jgi:hypothetical protein
LYEREKEHNIYLMNTKERKKEEDSNLEKGNLNKLKRFNTWRMSHSIS